LENASYHKKGMARRHRQSQNMTLARKSGTERLLECFYRFLAVYTIKVIEKQIISSRKIQQNNKFW